MGRRQLALGDYHHSGTFTAPMVVGATGALSEPRMPGTGASAAQFVPEIQPRVAQLILFQRTEAWVVPRRDDGYSPRPGPSIGGSHWSSAHCAPD